jgi:hypothetical protein
LSAGVISGWTGLGFADHRQRHPDRRCAASGKLWWCSRRHGR